ncbi:MAG: GMC family oxidoreductase [Vicinamibacteria bacterium]|nr:GMC family oxidoreductase [Vicinamibacteria bacterium]
MQIRPKRTTFDVVIVGSGASGGWAAKRLTEAGLRVAVLEAGRQLTDADYKEHLPAYGLPYRGRSKRPLERERPVQSGSYAVREWNADWFVNDIDEPYVDKSDPAFLWVRPRLVGGRTNVWGRECLRLSDMEFKAASHDGAGVDWPIGYADIAPYYDLVEDYVGIAGMTEGLAELPDGRFQPAMPLTCAETALRTRIKATFGRTLTQGRTANLTRPIHGRQACHYCGPCEHGCVTHSYFNASFTTMADAMATGRCTLVTGAMAYKVLVDPSSHRARGVLYVDRTTRQPREIVGRVVALCAQTQESVRVLFNSATGQDANGLANSSGLLGKGLMTHFSDAGATGELSEFVETPALGGPQRPCSPLLVRFRNLPGGRATKEFQRGYAYGTYVGGGANLGAPGYGNAYKRAVVEPRATQVTMQGFGECLRYEDNYVDVDPHTVDAFGIPVARIHLTPRANEHAMQADMAVAAAEMLEAAGARNVRQWHGMRGQAHEVGAARMGTDPKTSVLNPFLQTHDIKNLFVMDGSSFPSSAWQNPTLTIMALAVRSSDYLKEQLRQGTL